MTIYFADNNGGRNWKVRAATEKAAWERLAKNNGASITAMRRGYDVVFPDRGSAQMFEDLAEHEKAVGLLIQRAVPGTRKRRRYNPERSVWKGISHRRGTSGHDGTRIRDLRDAVARRDKQ